MTQECRDRIGLLTQNDLSIQLRKNDEVFFESREPMLKPLFRCLEEHRDEMAGATVIDKIVGLAAAYLCDLGGVRAVCTPTASESAREHLIGCGIELSAMRIIPQIINRQGNGPCPMEQLAVASGSPEAFYRELKKRIEL